MVEEVVRELKLLPFELKEQQLEIVNRLLENFNVFGILPTGYGKSECYGIFPDVHKHIKHTKQSTALIISPLRSLMFDQQQRWSALGITTGVITRKDEMSSDQIQDILTGSCKLVFSSPEAILQDEWWEMVKKLRKQICLLVFDEAHCLIKWGESFREDYLKVTSLRSLLPQAPVLALTATMTKDIHSQLLKVLHIKPGNTKLIGIIPDRPNIHLDITRVDEDKCVPCIDWYIDHLREQGTNAPRAIIYTRTIDGVVAIYGAMMCQLGESAWKSKEKVMSGRLIEMFHSQTDEDSQKRVLRAFSVKDSALRCVVATIAFGMGVQVPDVNYIIHWGPSKDCLNYWQEVGRCSRDGSPGHASMLVYPRSLNKRFIKEDMSTLIKKATSKQCCIRKYVLEQMSLNGMLHCENSENITNCCGVCNVSKIPSCLKDAFEEV